MANDISRKIVNELGHLFITKCHDLQDKFGLTDSQIFEIKMSALTHLISFSACECVDPEQAISIHKSSLDDLRQRRDETLMDMSVGEMEH